MPGKGQGGKGILIQGKQKFFKSLLKLSKCYKNAYLSIIVYTNIFL
jgi:hypothetical protein